MLQNGGPKSSSTNRLYKQLPDGRFKDVSKGSGLDIAGWNMGVAVGDVNNDGRPDVLVTQYGGVKLFLNNGDGTFTDVTGGAGPGKTRFGRPRRRSSTTIATAGSISSWSTTSIMIRPGPARPSDGRATTARRMYSRQPSPNCSTTVAAKGGPPRFEDVTKSSGLARFPAPGWASSAPTSTATAGPTFLLPTTISPTVCGSTRRMARSEMKPCARGVAYDGMGKAQSGMGVALGDLDGDGMEDLFVTHLTAETNTLWMQKPRGLFRDRTGASGLASPRWRGTGWGTVMADFDLDGTIDLAVVNGGVSRITPLPGAEALGPFWSAYAERNQLFVGDGKGRFRDLSPTQPELCGRPNVGRGLVVGDVNGDGAPDLLVTTVGGRARLLLNRAPNPGHWLTVRPFDPALNRDAVGATVTVHAGGRSWLRRADPCGSYLCSSDPRFVRLGNSGDGGRPRGSLARRHASCSTAGRLIG